LKPRPLPRITTAIGLTQFFNTKENYSESLLISIINPYLQVSQKLQSQLFTGFNFSISSGNGRRGKAD